MDIQLREKTGKRQNLGLIGTEKEKYKSGWRAANEIFEKATENFDEKKWAEKTKEAFDTQIKTWQTEIEDLEKEKKSTE